MYIAGVAVAVVVFAVVAGYLVVLDAFVAVFALVLDSRSVVALVLFADYSLASQTALADRYKTLLVVVSVRALELEADKDVVKVEAASRTARRFQRLLTLIAGFLAVVSVLLAPSVGLLLLCVVVAFVLELPQIFGKLHGLCLEILNFMYTAETYFEVDESANIEKHTKCNSVQRRISKS